MIQHGGKGAAQVILVGEEQVLGFRPQAAQRQPFGTGQGFGHEGFQPFPLRLLQGPGQQGAPLDLEPLDAPPAHRFQQSVLRMPRASGSKVSGPPAFTWAS